MAKMIITTILINIEITIINRGGGESIHVRIVIFISTILNRFIASKNRFLIFYICFFPVSSSFRKHSSSLAGSCVASQLLLTLVLAVPSLKASVLAHVIIYIII